VAQPHVRSGHPSGRLQRNCTGDRYAIGACVTGASAPSGSGTRELSEIPSGSATLPWRSTCPLVDMNADPLSILPFPRGPVRVTSLRPGESSTESQPPTLRTPTTGTRAMAQLALPTAIPNTAATLRSVPVDREEPTPPPTNGTRRCAVSKKAKPQPPETGHLLSSSQALVTESCQRRMKM